MNEGPLVTAGFEPKAAQRRMWLHLHQSRLCLGYMVAEVVKGNVVPARSWSNAVLDRETAASPWLSGQSLAPEMEEGVL